MSIFTCQGLVRRLNRKNCGKAGETMHILLHNCCGPCTIYPYKELLSRGMEVTGYFYNPNIHPYKEFVKRRDTLLEFATRKGLKVIIDDRYQLEEFLTGALRNLADRCRACYEMRLREAAKIARRLGCDCFTTTLLVSPYQKHELVREIGEQIATQEGMPFCYIDFRPGWAEGVAEAKGMGLYRQPYCGCIFSEKERYYKPHKGQK